MEINDVRTREAAFVQAKGLSYEPKERYVLFELRVQEATATIYDSGEPKRTKWKSDEA